MKHVYDHEKYQRLLSKFGFLFKNILASHGQDHVTDMVMHELCGQSGFDVPRAAYFVDNPDFDCLQGVSGYCRDEMGSDACDWHNKDVFAQKLDTSKFNKNVKNFNYKSIKKSGKSDAALVTTIAQSLEIPNPGYYSWDMKHDNHGIFVYQKHAAHDELREHLQDAVCLLGFCPLF